MVISAENPTPPPDPASVAASPPRSFYNFSSVPILKTWGQRKVLRCLNVNRKGEAIRSPPSTSPSPSSPESSSPPRSKEEDDDEGFERVRAKLLVHLQEAADRMNLVTIPLAVRNPKPVAVAATPTPAPCSPSPWNLRTRRAALARVRSHSPPHVPAPTTARTVRLRSEAVEKKERPRFSISLSMREIDEDIYAVTGSRARRRPKKRPRAVQNQVDMVFPGRWLAEITADTYRVPE